MKRLQLELLEGRQLMAGDVSPFHNNIWPTDVNRDFDITPLDALIVINDINLNGNRSLPTAAPASPNTSMVDVNSDGRLTPNDVLIVLNAINAGEGVGELVEFKYEFLSTSGVSLDPNPSDSVVEYQVSLGSEFILRTSVLDLRANPRGVASAYSDVNIVNQDSGAAEIASFQYGEYVELTIPTTTTSGNFALQFGTGGTAQKTQPISLTFPLSNATRRNEAIAKIRTAVGNLTLAGGEANVAVRYDDKKSDDNKWVFGIEFLGAKARVNIANATVADSTLRDASNNAVVASSESFDGNNPALDLVTRTGFDFTNSTFTDAVEGTYTNPSTGTFSFVSFGGFSQVLPADGGEYVKVVDTLFKADRAGKVIVSGVYPTVDGREVLLHGLNDVIPADKVILQTGIPLTVVSGVNAVADSFTFNEDVTTQLTVTSNDQLINGTSFSIDAVNGATTGSIQVRDSSNALAGTVTFTRNTNNPINFVPAANYNGTATFTYTIKSNLNETSTATVTVNISAVNDNPVLRDATHSTSQGVALNLIASQVFDPGPANESSQTVTFTGSGGTPTGTVTRVGGTITYTPANGFVGNDVFTVTARDNGSPALSTTSTITVTVDDVNDAPVPFLGPINTNEDTALILIGTGAPSNILTSSSPGPGESNQTVSLVSIAATSAQGGTITTSGSITRYTPPAEFSGTDTIVYTITDNGTPALQATGTLTINVVAQNDAPNAVNDSATAIGISTEPTDIDVLNNDTAGDSGDTIRVVSVGTPSLGGTVTIIDNGQAVRYNPPEGQAGVNETFTYTIQDAGGLQDTATVTVSIETPSLPFARSNTFPTVASQIVEDVLTPFEMDVLANDLKNTGATLYLINFTQPAKGTVTLVDNGTPADRSDDKLSFVPNANEFGRTTFTYGIAETSDATTAQSTATVTINISEVNDDPTAIPRSFNGTEDTPLTITGASLLAGLSKGTGEDAQTLTVTGVSAVSNNAGTVVLQSGNVVYTPAANFNSDTGTFLFTYTVTDNGTTAGANNFKSATATVTVSLAAANDDPISANPDLGAGNEDVTRTIAISDLLANDRPGPASAADEASQNLSLVSFTGTQATANGGTIQISGDGLSIIYQPAANYFGSDSFTYTITDDGSPAKTATGTASLTVTSVNDAPTTQVLTQTANTGIVKTFNISSQVASFSPGPANESSQRVRLVAVNGTSSNGGTVSLASDGTITYRSATSFSGTDVITYTVSDNGSPEAIATGTINVTVSPFVPSSISGVVWMDDRFGDSDRDGNRIEAGELRLGGVELVISGTVIGQSARYQDSILTLPDGSYSFDGLAPGVYTVTMVNPVVLVDGPDYAGAQGDGDSVENSFTISIAAPGPVNAANYNFSVLGVDPRYASGIDNLASSFYNLFPNLRQRGIYAGVGSDGSALWSARKDGYADAEFLEVVLSSDGTQAFVTKVSRNSAGDHIVSTATVNKNRFVKMADGAGNMIIQVLQGSSELTWSAVDLANPPSRTAAYLDSINRIFAQEDW